MRCPALATLSAAALLLITGARSARADIVDAALASDLGGAICSTGFIIEISPNNFVSFHEDQPIAVLPGGVARSTKHGTFDWLGQSYAWGFDFTVQGELASAHWSLQNSSSDARVFLQSVILFQGSSPVVFDAGITPSTPGSGPGIFPAISYSGAPVTTTSFGVLWSNPQNAGDLFTDVLVGWVELPNYTVLPIGATAVFGVDGDLVVNGPKLEISGPCPGNRVVLGSKFTPQQSVAVLWSLSPAATTVPATSALCAGAELGLDANLALLGLFTSTPSGRLSLTLPISPALCGAIYVQMFDIASCQASNVGLL